MSNYPISVAPMLDWTTRHCRYFHRLLSPNAILWTEMITTAAILHGDKNRLLDYDTREQPLVLQLGGSDIKQMTTCAKIAQDWGYKEININVGCPSDRVQSGSFGACLMKTPQVVADCVASMSNSVDIPISVKSRIGVDEQEGYEALYDFVNIVHRAGCIDFIIHARKAWLKGLSPKQNRSVPPLDYNKVYQIKADFPDCSIHINGGLQTLDDIKQQVSRVDGVMIGRAFYHNPYLLSEIEQDLNPNFVAKSRENLVLEMMEYIKQQHSLSVPTRAITRHMLGLYHARPNARKYKQLLSGKIVGVEHLETWLEFIKNSIE